MSMRKEDTVAPKRAGFLMTLWIIIASAATTLYHCLVVLTMTGRQRPDYRRRVDRVIRSWADSLIRIVDMRLSVKGREHWRPTPGRAYLIMSSHASNYDIPATYLALDGSIRMLAKRELLSIPIFGRAMRVAEFLFVDRRNHEQALKDLAFAKKKMEDGIILWMAPEGTRSRDGRLQPLKKGGFHLAFDTDAIVVPIGFRNIATVQPAKTLRWTLHQPVECHIGQPIDTRQFSKRDIPALMAEVREQLLVLTGEADEVSRLGEGKVETSTEQAVPVEN